MSLNQAKSEKIEILLSLSDKWQVYQRLQQLQIPCEYQYNQPLRVEINSALAVIQLRSIVKQVKETRKQLISWLELCFSLETEQEN